MVLSHNIDINDVSILHQNGQRKPSYNRLKVQQTWSSINFAPDLQGVAGSHLQFVTTLMDWLDQMGLECTGKTG